MNKSWIYILKHLYKLKFNYKPKCYTKMESCRPKWSFVVILDNHSMCEMLLSVIAVLCLVGVFAKENVEQKPNIFLILMDDMVGFNFKYNLVSLQLLYFKGVRWHQPSWIRSDSHSKYRCRSQLRHWAKPLLYGSHVHSGQIFVANWKISLIRRHAALRNFELRTMGTKPYRQVVARIHEGQWLWHTYGRKMACGSLWKTENANASGFWFLLWVLRRNDWLFQP